MTLCVAAAAALPKCAPFDPAAQARATAYLRAFFHFPAGLSLSRATQVTGSCYIQLDYFNPADGHTYRFYVAPDRQFLTAAIYDMRAALAPSPAAAESLAQRLLRDPSPSRGPAAASVTIVEFSDFECPFCRQLSRYESQVLPGFAGRVRIVFKFLPLADIHPWALAAAEGAGCAALQSDRYFWRLHDFLFANQPRLSTSTVAATERRELALAPGFSLSAYDRCLAFALSRGTIDRDTALANQLGITATPTFFINGSRHVGIASASALRAAISAALQPYAGRPAARP